jgi:hypothetical protein
MAGGRRRGLLLPVWRAQRAHLEGEAPSQSDGDGVLFFMRVDSEVCFLHGVSCGLYGFMYADRPGLPGSPRYPRRHASVLQQSG